MTKSSRQGSQEDSLFAGNCSIISNKELFLGIEMHKFAWTLDELLDAAIDNISSRRNYVVYTSTNLHAMSIMQNDKEFCKVLNEADKITFDGVAAIWLVFLSTGKKAEKIGADVLMKALSRIAQQKDWSFYLLGGPKGAAERAAERIREKFPEVNIVGTHHGYFDSEEEKNILKEINQLSPDILAVGLGMPHQEKWIYKNKERLKVGLITNCGGYIEQTANKGMDYYPDWAYRYNLNWFYRILKEPRRLWKRYLFEGIAFLPFLFNGLFGYLLVRFIGFNGKKHERET